MKLKLLILVYCVLVLFFFGCKPEELIKVTKLQTGEITEVTATTAKATGAFIDISGNVSDYGHCWNKTGDPAVADEKNVVSGTAQKGEYISSLSGLINNTKYFVRAYAIDDGEAQYGGTVSFTTLGLPTATTEEATSITNATATLNGSVNIFNLSTTITFEYGTSSNYGSSINAVLHSIPGGSNIAATANLTNLITGYTYHFRVKVVCDIGIVYGEDMSFTTIFKDQDNNIYNLVSIGTQVWMSENLKTTKYRNNENIPIETENDLWYNLTTPGYCWFNNYSPIKDQFGALYNWYTVNTGILCPSGWHVPTEADWNTLITFLGGESVAGNKLKEAGTTNWYSPNTDATNESAFTALPGGQRDYYGSFYDLGTYGYWWSSIESSGTDSWTRYMTNNSGNVYYMSSNKKKGFSVRCIKD
jgi:uncharacterized protein (TIGR02145 family)